MDDIIGSEILQSMDVPRPNIGTDYIITTTPREGNISFEGKYVRPDRTRQIFQVNKTNDPNDNNDKIIKKYKGKPLAIGSETYEVTIPMLDINNIEDIDGPPILKGGKKRNKKSRRRNRKSKSRRRNRKSRSRRRF
jgi:hypothetical protein